MNSSKRKHIRLRYFDYSSENAYFITICTKDREQSFGIIINDVMLPSPIGKIAERYWVEIPLHDPHIVLDEFVVMPNHVHGILILNYSLVGTRQGVSKNTKSIQTNKFAKPVSGSISVIVGQYKSSVKKWCNNSGFENFEWQSRFYDHVIRNAKSHETIRNYIANNIANWKGDKFHP